MAIQPRPRHPQVGRVSAVQAPQSMGSGNHGAAHAGGEARSVESGTRGMAGTGAGARSDRVAWDLGSDVEWSNFVEVISQLRLAGKRPQVQIVTDGRKRRTLTQNACLHDWLGKLADALNTAGLDMRTLLKPEIDIPWTQHAAKEHLWRPVQEAMTGKRSTAQAETVDYPAVYDVLCRHLASKHGITPPPWPTRFGE